MWSPTVWSLAPAASAGADPRAADPPIQKLWGAGHVLILRWLPHTFCMGEPSERAHMYFYDEKRFKSAKVHAEKGAKLNSFESW